MIWWRGVLARVVTSFQVCTLILLYTTTKAESCLLLAFQSSFLVYFVFILRFIGDISTEIFRDDCEFTDPTNTVSSLSKYQKAHIILFNPDQSFVELVQPLEIDVPKREITGRIRSGGVLKLPWNPRISPYER